MSDTNDLYPAERLISYSDAIFSIALTLLVIEIRLPEVIHHGVLNAIAESWPQFLSLMISFLIITVVWFNHHEMFHKIKFVDYRLIIYNTLLMLNIVLIPFVSSLLGRSFELEGFDSKISCVIYGIWIAIGGLPFNLLWNPVYRKPALLKENTNLEEVKNLSNHYWKGPMLYSIAALSSFISIWAGVTFYILLIVLYFIPASMLKKPIHSND